MTIALLGVNVKVKVNPNSPNPNAVGLTSILHRGQFSSFFQLLVAGKDISTHSLNDVVGRPTVSNGMIC